MRKALAIILMCSMLLLLVACGRNEPAAPAATEAPATEAPAVTEAPAADASQTGNDPANYVIEVEDQDGKPVAGVMIQFCNPDTCQVLSTDQDGKVENAAAPYAYEVHVLKAPEGYDADSTLYTMPAEGGELVITLNKQ